MKTRNLIAGVLVLTATVTFGATNDLTSALQRGLFEEEANHNLEAAAQAYQAVSAQFDRDRKLAATAIFRLGEVYRKQGKTNDAVAQYDRIVREFSDQATLVTLSRQNLAGLRPYVIPPHLPAPPDNQDFQQRLLEILARSGADTNAFAQRLRTIPERTPRTASTAPDESSFQERLNEIITRAAAGYDTNSEVGQRLQRIIQRASADNTQALPVTDDEEKEIRRIQVMIQNSPDLINAPASGGSITPLCNAARNGQLRVARFLLDAGAVVDLPAGGSSPIHNAAAGGHKAMVELLLDYKADANVRDSSGKTPLHSAAENGFQSVVEALLARKADVNAQTKNQDTPLRLAAAKGHSAMVDLLIAKGAQLDTKGDAGWTALTAAARQGHALVVKRLLEARADPNILDGSGQTALSQAVGRGHADVVKALLEAKADPNTGEKDLPLAMAVRYKQLEIAGLLLRAGAKPDLAGKTSQYVGEPGSSQFGGGRSGNTFGPYTPLQIAVSQGDVAMVKLLFTFKADASAKNEPWSSTPQPLVFYALADEEMLKAFLDGGADPDCTDNTRRPLILAAADRDASRVEPLIAHGANVNVRGENGLTPLHVAVIRDDKKSVELFLNAKAEVNAIDASGIAALHRATGNGSGEIVEMLLAHEANPNLKDQTGNTPLHWAVGIGGKGIGAQKMVELLLSKGADPNLRNNDGRTALDLAKGVNNPASPGFGVPGTPLPPTPSIPTRTLRQLAAPESPAKTQPVDLATLLREHGAVDDLPDFSSIRVMRAGIAQPIVVFVKDTNAVNRFTLLEVIWNYYPYPNSPIERLPFPDFSKILIHRPVADKPGAQKQITVNLLTVTNTFDCGKDTWLEFGDMVEIPEREHTLAEQPFGLNGEQRQDLSRCLEGKVTFVVRGQKAELKLDGTGYTRWLQLALGNVKNLLRSSSDLSHIKIKRTDPATGKTNEIIADSKVSQPNNVWLRDGDVIEVPDKP